MEFSFHWILAIYITIVAHIHLDSDYGHIKSQTTSMCVHGLMSTVNQSKQRESSIPPPYISLNVSHSIFYLPLHLSLSVPPFPSLTVPLLPSLSLSPSLPLLPSHSLSFPLIPSHSLSVLLSLSIFPSHSFLPLCPSLSFPIISLFLSLYFPPCRSLRLLPSLH